MCNAHINAGNLGVLITVSLKCSPAKLNFYMRRLKAITEKYSASIWIYWQKLCAATAAEVSLCNTWERSAEHAYFSDITIIARVISNSSQLWVTVRQQFVTFRDAVRRSSVFTARAAMPAQSWGVVILSVCLPVRLSHTCFVTKPNNALRIFWYHTKSQSL